MDGVNRASSIATVWLCNLTTPAIDVDITQHIDGLGNERYVTLPGTSVTQQGIFQIQARNAGSDNVWVWTLWVVPTTNDYYNIKYYLGDYSRWHYNGYTFMDRNLGTLAAFPAGLYYQWGRKDPASPLFPICQTTQVPANMDEVEIANYPTTFYTSAAAPYDWMSAGQHNNLWTTIDGEKGPYDPCPFGWRVPVASNDAASPFEGFTNGLNGLNFVAAGTRSGYSGIDGSPINTSKAIVWGASARGTSAYIYNVTDHDHGTARRADAYPIRCVRDVKRIGY
jgi:hypothetical protein